MRLTLIKIFEKKFIAQQSIRNRRIMFEMWIDHKHVSENTRLMSTNVRQFGKEKLNYLHKLKALEAICWVVNKLMFVRFSKVQSKPQLLKQSIKPSISVEILLMLAQELHIKYLDRYSKLKGLIVNLEFCVCTIFTINNHFVHV